MIENVYQKYKRTDKMFETCDNKRIEIVFLFEIDKFVKTKRHGREAVSECRPIKVKEMSRRRCKKAESSVYHP